jgi:hypothetical protein
MLWKKWATGRLELETVHDVGIDLAMPPRKRTKMNSGLRCWPLAGGAEMISSGNSPSRDQQLKR